MGYIGRIKGVIIAEDPEELPEARPEPAAADLAAPQPEEVPA
jgi:hypothetical protein